MIFELHLVFALDDAHAIDKYPRSYSSSVPTLHASHLDVSYFPSRLEANLVEYGWGSARRIGSVSYGPRSLVSQASGG